MARKIVEMNLNKIVKSLKNDGWTIKRQSGPHDVWAKPGNESLFVPRHTELSIGVAKQIAKALGYI